MTIVQEEPSPPRISIRAHTAVRNLIDPIEAQIGTEAADALRLSLYRLIEHERSVERRLIQTEVMMRASEMTESPDEDYAASANVLHSLAHWIQFGDEVAP